MKYSLLSKPGTYREQVQRVLTACSEYHAESYESVLAALYKEFWVNKQAVQRAEIFESILCRFIGRTAAADLMQKVNYARPRTDKST